MADDLQRQYDLALRHYECDLNLHVSRMNLFLLIETALIGLVGLAPSELGARRL